MIGAETYELGAVVSLRDYMSDGLDRVEARWDSWVEKLRGHQDDLEWLESSWSRVKLGAGMLAASGVMLGAVRSMASARVESTALEANLRSLGLSADEVAGISSQSTILAARFGLAKESILSGVYDIRSAVETLDAASLPQFTEAIMKTAAGTKGSFEDLSETFGMVYNQFASRYADLSQVEFAQNLGNAITWTANKFRADGATINQAFTTLGNSASVAGYTLETQSAVIGRALNTMIPSTAGTSFRSFIERLPQAGEKLGIEVFDEMTGKLKPVPDILDAINAKYPDLARSSKILNEAFSEEGVKFVKAMSGETGKLRDDIAELATMSQNKDWSMLDQAAETNLESFASTLNRLSEGWAAIWADMGDGPVTVLSAVLTPLADIVEYFAKLSGQHPGLMRVIGGLITLTAVGLGVAGAFMVINGALSMYKILNYHAAIASATSASAAHGLGVAQLAASSKTWLATVATSAFSAALWANPITWVVGSLIALVAVLGYVIYNFDDLKTRWDNMPTWIRMTFGLVTAFFELGDAMRIFYNNSDDLEQAFALSWGSLPGWIKTGMNALLPMVGMPLAIAGSWGELKQAWAQLLGGDLIGALDTLGAAARNSGFGVIMDFFGGVYDGVTGAFDVLETIGKGGGLGLMKAFGEGIVKGGTALLEKLRGVFTGLDQLLPHSDAKTGPLSRLTASGRALVTTFAGGMERESSTARAAGVGVAEAVTPMPQASPIEREVAASTFGGQRPAPPARPIVQFSFQSLISELTMYRGADGDFSITADELAAIIMAELQRTAEA